MLHYVAGGTQVSSSVPW